MINKRSLYPYFAPLILGFLLQAKTCLLCDARSQKLKSSITKAVFWFVSASALGRLGGRVKSFDFKHHLPPSANTVANS